MLGHRFAATLVFLPVLAGIGGTIGFTAALTTGVVTRELPGDVTETIHPLPNKERAPVGKRANVNLTGANCASSCKGVAGTGPNQGDCNQIINTLNWQGAGTFTVNPYSVANWAYASCTIEFVQATADTVTYTYNYLGAVASYLSNTCNAANGYAIGRCIFDGRENAIWVGNTAVSDQSRI